jgi:hypothetical protein
MRITGNRREQSISPFGGQRGATTVEPSYNENGSGVFKNTGVVFCDLR